MRVIYVLMVLALIGCTSDSVDDSGEIAELRKEIEELKNQETPNSKEENEEAERIEAEKEAERIRVAEAEKFVRIGNLEVMKEDLSCSDDFFDWDKAKKACAALGDGWRLPTKAELNILYQNKEKIGGFASNYYWSSTEGDILYSVFTVWRQNFRNGNQNEYKVDIAQGCARAVRDL